MIRTVLRLVLALLYAIAGVLHLVAPRPFLAIMPGGLPFPNEIVFLTGIAEILGAAALAQGWSASLRKAGAIGLALYAVCVFPANINHMILDMSSPDPKLGWAYHGPRMLLQPVLVWLALWVSGVIDWPFRKGRAA